jgi:hypothetical protein
MYWSFSHMPVITIVGIGSAVSTSWLGWARITSRTDWCVGPVVGSVVVGVGVVVVDASVVDGG